MSVVERQANNVTNFNHTSDARTAGEGPFGRLPAALIGKIAEFLPRTYGALPPVKKEWSIGVKSVKSIFSKKDKENLDLIAVFQRLGGSCERVRLYLESHPIAHTQLKNKRAVERIAGEIRTWISTNPDYAHHNLRSEPMVLYLSGLKLHTLPLVSSLKDCIYIDLSHNLFTDLRFIKQLPPNVQSIKMDSNPFKRSTKVTLFLQKTLLVLSTAAAILCVIPPIRSIGSLILRSLSCLSSTLVAKNSLEHEDRLSAVLKCMKIATAILGLTGLILGQPYLIVGALAADIILQLCDCIRGAIQGNEAKAFFNLSFAILNGLVLAALASGLWPIVIAAAALSSALMLVMALHSGLSGYPLECICNVILIGVGMTAAIVSAEMKYIDNYHYEYTNATDDKVLLWDGHGHKWMVNPGESITFDLPSDSVHLQLPLEIPPPWGPHHWLAPVSFHETIAQQPIPRSDFPTVPIGSPYLENFSIPFKSWARA